MSTPTEKLEDFVTAFELIYDAPTWSAVTAGAGDNDEGDLFITATVTVDAVDYDLRIDWRESGTSQHMAHFEITCASPHGTQDLSEYRNETATGATLCTVVTDWLADIDTRATNEAAYFAEFAEVVPP